MKAVKSAVCVCLALMFCGVCVPAVATLGEDAASVQADQARMEATLEISGTQRFSLYRMRLPAGTVVSEYVSPAGMVFAISWQGPVLPDLQQLLGRHFDQYAVAVRPQEPGPAARSGEASGLVVQSRGHMRAFSGRAYLRQMLPRGVLAEEIQ
ncbi:MAG: DUF2844 domain-containing protein [Proteobacteria bacterium]|nr:DUF2844 domain-containing protein [Pseudomonadota bacterium]